MNYALGKLPPVHDPRNLKLSKYLHAANLPPLKDNCNWSNGVTVPWGMMDNDQIGDCVCAAAAHIVMVTTANSDGVVVPTDAEVVTMYEKIGGYVPGDPSTDNGSTELDGLKYLKSTGLAGVTLDAFADVDQTNLDEVKMAIMLFGAAYIGVRIYQTDMDQAQAGQPWHITGTDGNLLGGHAIPLVDYDANGAWCVTWGELKQLTWGWFLARCDEAHVGLMLKWITDQGISPSGFDRDSLRADLAAL